MGTTTLVPPTSGLANSAGDSDIIASSINGEAPKMITSASPTSWRLASTAEVRSVPLDHSTSTPLPPNRLATPATSITATADYTAPRAPGAAFQAYDRSSRTMAGRTSEQRGAMQTDSAVLINDIKTLPSPASERNASTRLRRLLLAHPIRVSDPASIHHPQHYASSSSWVPVK
jgi:hypothetical protein